MGKMSADPMWINSPSGQTYDGGELRRADAGIFTHQGNPVVAMPGVLSAMPVSVDADNRTVRVGHGSCIISPLAGTASAGSYRVTLASTQTETLAAPDASFSRRDAIYVEVIDPEVTGGLAADIGAWLRVATGTPSSSPAAPAVPSGALKLAEVLMPPSGSPTVIDYRAYTSPIGGVINCTSLSRPAPSTYMRAGQPIYETDTGEFRVWTGSSWDGARLGRPAIFLGDVTSELTVPTSTVVNVPWNATTPSGTTPAVTLSGTSLTVQRTGLHRLFCQLTFRAGDGDGYCHTRLYLNGGLLDFMEMPLRDVNSSAQYERRRVLNAGDVITFAAYQNSGVSTSLRADYGLSRCEIERISD